MDKKRTMAQYDGHSELACSNGHENGEGFWTPSKVKTAVQFIRTTYGRPLTKSEFIAEAQKGNCPPLQQVIANHGSLGKFYRAHGIIAVRSKGSV